MLTGRRYLLALTDEQTAYAETVGAICRAVWNIGLEQRREYRRRGAFISYYEQRRQMIDAKYEFDGEWLGGFGESVGESHDENVAPPLARHGSGDRP